MGRGRSVRGSEIARGREKESCRGRGRGEINRPLMISESAGGDGGYIRPGHEKDSEEKDPLIFAENDEDKWQKRELKKERKKVPLSLRGYGAFLARRGMHEPFRGKNVFVICSKQRT